jgi:hypothetical protein
MAGRGVRLIILSADAWRQVIAGEEVKMRE